MPSSRAWLLLETETTLSPKTCTLTEIDIWCEQIAAGKQHAFAHLYEALNPLLAALLTVSSGGTNRAERLTDVFLRIWCDAPRRAPSSPALVWILAIVHAESGNPGVAGDVELLVLAGVGRFGYEDLARLTGQPRASVVSRIRTALHAQSSSRIRSDGTRDHSS